MSAHATDADRSTPMRADARRNRAKIVAAAKEEFGERGLDAQMEDVARRAGVGVGTLYRHFPTKDALVEALIVDKMQRLADSAREAREHDDPWEALSGCLWNHAEHQVRDRTLAEVLASQPAGTFLKAAQEDTDLAEQMAALLRRAQEAGAVRPDVRPDDIPLMMCGLGAVVRNGRDWERYLRLMLDGLAASSSDPLPE